jgi:hypothetical protein
MEPEPKRGRGRPPKVSYDNPVTLEPELRARKPRKAPPATIKTPPKEIVQAAINYPEPVENLGIQDQPFILFLAAKWEQLQGEIDDLMIPVDKKKAEQEYLFQLTQDYRVHLETPRPEDEVAM